MSELPKTFCILPWVHIATNTSGAAQLCCIAQETLQDEDGKPYLLNKRSIEEIWNSQSMIEARRKMLQGEQVTACTRCYDEERIGKFSRRLSSNEKWLGILAESEDSRLTETSADQPIVNQDPIFFDLRQGNLCNLKCRMCSPLYSSAIESEFRILAKQDSHFSNELRRIESDLTNMNWSEDENFVANIKKYLPNANTIYFAGGEPTLVKNNFKLMQTCIDVGAAKNIELVFSTNATRLKPEFLDLLKHFRRVVLNLSVDGVGDEQEYIRFGSNWAEIEANLRSLISMNLTNVKAIFTPVVQILNVLNIDRLFTFADKLNIEYGRDFFTILPIVLQSPAHLQFALLPKEIKEQAATKIRNYMNTTKSQHDLYFTEKLNQLLQFLNHHQVDARDLQLKNFFTEQNKFDAFRKQSLRQNFPELIQAWSALEPEYIKFLN